MVRDVIVETTSLCFGFHVSVVLGHERAHCKTYSFPTDSSVPYLDGARALIERNYLSYCTAVQSGNLSHGWIALSDITSFRRKKSKKYILSNPNSAFL